MSKRLLTRVIGCFDSNLSFFLFYSWWLNGPTWIHNFENGDQGYEPAANAQENTCRSMNQGWLWKKNSCKSIFTFSFALTQVTSCWRLSRSLTVHWNPSFINKTVIRDDGDSIHRKRKFSLLAKPLVSMVCLNFCSRKQEFTVKLWFHLFLKRFINWARNYEKVALKESHH